MHLLSKVMLEFHSKQLRQSRFSNPTPGIQVSLPRNQGRPMDLVISSNQGLGNHDLRTSLQCSCYAVLAVTKGTLRLMSTQKWIILLSETMFFQKGTLVDLNGFKQPDLVVMFMDHAMFPINH